MKLLNQIIIALAAAFALAAITPQAYAQGGVALWTNRYNGLGNGDDYAYAVAADSGGNVFVTGLSSAGGGNYSYATVAFSGTGVPLWTNRYDGPLSGYNQANAVAVDSNGNVFVTGYSTGSSGAPDYATVAYSSAGVPLWTNRYDGTGNYNDFAHAVAVDGNGNVFVTGQSDGGSSHNDYATIKYSNDGVELWANRYSGPTGSGSSDDGASAVAV